MGSPPRASSVARWPKLVRHTKLHSGTSHCMLLSSLGCMYLFVLYRAFRQRSFISGNQTTYHYLMSLAGAVGAMSLGCGVGDIMAISGLAVKVYTAYKDAPDEYRNISDEVESLYIIIQEAAQHFEGAKLCDNTRQKGPKILKGCQNILEDLDALIIKYNSIASGSTGRVIQRIKLGTEDISSLRIRLISNTGLLNGFIQRFNTPKITIGKYFVLISLP